MRAWIIVVTALMSLAIPAAADEADVLDVQLRQAGDGSYSFTVTVRHADAGWDHYADRWEVVAPDGTVLGTRVLLHPHDNEQPFTRGQSGIRIPADVDSVIVRAHDSVDGFGGVEQTVTVPR